MKFTFATLLAAVAVAAIAVPSANANPIVYTYQFTGNGNSALDGSTITITDNSGSLTESFHLTYNGAYGGSAFTLTPSSSFVVYNNISLSSTLPPVWDGAFSVLGQGISNDGDYFDCFGDDQSPNAYAVVVGNSDGGFYVSISGGTWNLESNGAVPDNGSTVGLLGLSFFTLALFGFRQNRLQLRRQLAK